MVPFETDILDLDSFLKLPEFRPPVEFLGGRMIQKMSPTPEHSEIGAEFRNHLNAFAIPRSLGRAYVKVRFVLGRDSPIPDVCFIPQTRIATDPEGRRAPDTRTAPDIAIEIASPGQGPDGLVARLRRIIRRGTRLGWLVLPDREEVWVVRSRHSVEVLKPGQSLTGEDVLPGYMLSVADIFAWGG